ncbi:unnamed protein product [Adineta ricciae]|uniref:F-box domain-containing protein n=1 Tax=Adineta ricciae TaxID=249248 RepID=A0A815VK56_ADIRI|nr:unnamed protein product [Adineta ricciae]CAF1533358.1 unnamed protein product [Adineta ricciae]
MMNMNDKKRSWNSTFDNSNDKYITNKKFQSNSSLEHLSNELIYEIFHYLDAHHIYQSFFELNTRFQNLSTHSTQLTVQINMISTSKLLFESYYNNFILPNKHQIQILYLLDPFVAESFSSTISQCFHLRQLKLCEIPVECLENLLHNLVSLNNLSSLSIHVGQGANKSNIYQSIFHLQALKLCKLHFEDNNPVWSLPMSSNSVESPIENLVIYDSFALDNISAILSYIPKLQRLSIKYGRTFGLELSLIFAVVFNDLKHISIMGSCFTQPDIDKFIKIHLFNIKVLHISSTCYGGIYQWDKFIQPYIPHFKLNSFTFEHPSECAHIMNLYRSMYDEYPSTSPAIRQWFFTHEVMSDEDLHEMLCSIQPYQRQSFLLLHRCCMNSKCHVDMNYRSIHHLIIPEMVESCKCIPYFPNVTKMTLSGDCVDSFYLSGARLSFILSFKQLTSLAICTVMDGFDIIFSILHYTPNVHSLTFTFTTTRSKGLSSFHKGQSYQYIVNHNQIKTIIFNAHYTKKLVQFFMDLCPRLQYLIYGMSEKSLEATFQYVLTETNQTAYNQFSLCIFDVNANWIDKLQTIIESQELKKNHLIKTVNNKFYFKWWY